MNFRRRDLLIAEAKKRLEGSRTNHKKLVLIYAGVMAAVLLALTVAVNLLEGEIAHTGGLSGIQTRAVLETVISLLELGGNWAIPFWTFGYVLCMLGVVRGKRMEPEDLLTGFRRFGPVLRLNIYRGLRYALIAMLSIYPSVFLFLMTPFAQPLQELLMPLAASGMDTAQMMLTLDDAALQVMSDAMVPMMGVYAVVFLGLALPVFYQMRFADYFLMDDPKTGALMAVRKSTVLMHRNRLEMFKLDLRFWWYYGLQGVALLICYAPMMGQLLGIPVPDGADMVCYVVYLVAQLGITVLGRNWVEATTALAYEALLQPREQEPEKPKNVPWKW